MKAIVDRPEPRFEYMRVDLCRRKIGVAEHGLNGAQIGAVLQQVRGKRMAEDVRAERPRNAGLLRVLLEDLPESYARKRAASCVEEQPCWKPRSAAYERGTAASLILVHPLHGGLADRNQPLLAAFSNARQILLLEVEIGWANIDELGDPHAGCIQQLDHRAIAQPERGADVGLCDERVDFVEGERSWQRRPRFRCLQLIRRVVRSMAVQREKAVEAADGGNLPRNRSRREAEGALAAHESFERAAVQLLGRVPFSTGERRQRPQIARVTVDGVIGQAPFHAEMIEVRIDHGRMLPSPFRRPEVV